MKINVHDIEEVAKDLVYEEPTADLNGELRRGSVHDFELPPTSEVRVQYNRAGRDLFFYGHISSRLTGECARCLENFPFSLETDFSIVLAPHTEGARDSDEDEDVELGYYDDEVVDLSPMIRERILLALPTRPLCREDCRGLCPQCGANRNENPCDCTEDVGDPRLSVLRTLKVSR